MWEKHKQKNAIRRAAARMAIDVRPTHFLTFSFGRRVRPEEGAALVEEFFKRADRAALGRNWYQFGATVRLAAVAFAEHLESNIHWHAAVAVPLVQSTSAECWAGLWSELSSHGQLHIELVSDEEAVAWYSTKATSSEENYELMVVYAP